MNPILRNILAVIAGIIIGSIANMLLLNIGGKIIPPPADSDMSTMEGMIAAMSKMESKHFVFPFLAHAIGTLVGAFVAAKIAVTQRMAMALIVGVFFLIGGAYMVFVLPSPAWFNGLDMIFAYIPMAFLGGKLAIKE